MAREEIFDSFLNAKMVWTKVGGDKFTWRDTCGRCGEVSVGYDIVKNGEVTERVTEYEGCNH